MSTESIRAIIADAWQHEASTGQLRELFEQQDETLRQSLVLPRVNAAECLVEFVGRYIDYVPVFIDGVRERIGDNGARDYVAPFLDMAEDYFLAPPEEVNEESGLQALLDEAFLAQRLIEEANDRHIQRHGRPLLPVDMTRANIIAANPA